MKNLERRCKVCDHPRRNHRDEYLMDGKGAKCYNCFSLRMSHEFELDNLKYLEEVNAKCLKNEKHN